MTYDAAMSQLKKLALANSPELVTCEEALPALSRSALQRMIHSKRIPALKINNRWRTTKKIGQAFWMLTWEPRPKHSAFVNEDLAAEHERARVAILGK